MLEENEPKDIDPKNNRILSYYFIVVLVFGAIVVGILLRIFDTAFDLLKEAMNDKDDWIGYFVYERDWLRDFKLGDVEVNGEPVKIYSWGDVYDFIVTEDKHV